MRIDPTSLHRPAEVNKPAETSAAPAVSESTKSDDALHPRHHFVRDRRRKNRRVEGRQGRGRRAGEADAQAPTVSAYQDSAPLDAPTQGPKRLVDIDC